MKDDEHNGTAYAEPAEPTGSRHLLALFDVLGFSQRVKRDGILKVLATYRDLIDTAVLEPARRCLGTVNTPEGRVMSLFVLPVRYAYFSDTILLWVPLEQVFAAAFVTRCADLMCLALRKGVPLRGALSLGEAVMHKATNTYLGEPLIEAAKLEKGQNWVGLTLANSATWPPFVSELEGQSIIEFTAPMKKGYEDFASPIVIDWPRIWRDSQQDSSEDYLKQINTDDKFSCYYENALAFVQYSKESHDWFKYPEKIRKDAKLRFAPYSEITKVK
jgi:hypothetical protein